MTIENVPHLSGGRHRKRQRRTTAPRLTRPVRTDPATVWPSVEAAVAGVPGLTLEGGTILCLTDRSATVSGLLGDRPVVVKVLLTTSGTWRPAALRLAKVGRHRWRPS